jgi:putative sigma-54 modulation protein
MDIKINAHKFDAGEKLNAFIEKKVARVEKFFAGAVNAAEVSLDDVKEGKKAKLQIHIPGEELVIERVADTFENAITECVDAMKEKLTRTKEKRYE